MVVGDLGQVVDKIIIEVEAAVAALVALEVMRDLLVLELVELVEMEKIQFQLTLL